MMFTRFITVKALVCMSAFLLVGQTSAYAGQQTPGLTPAPAQHFSRDLTYFDSQDFFKRGHDLIEGEIQILRRRPLDSTEPVLKINLCHNQKKATDKNTCLNGLSK